MWFEKSAEQIKNFKINCLVIKILKKFNIDNLNKFNQLFKNKKTDYVYIMLK